MLNNKLLKQISYLFRTGFKQLQSIITTAAPKQGYPSIKLITNFSGDVKSVV